MAWFLVAVLPVRLAHDRIEPVRYLARVPIVPDAVQFPRKKIKIKHNLA